MQRYFFNFRDAREDPIGDRCFHVGEERTDLQGLLKQYWDSGTHEFTVPSQSLLWNTSASITIAMLRNQSVYNL